MFQTLRARITAVIISVVCVTTLTVILIVQHAVETELYERGNSAALQILDTVMLSVENEYEGMIIDKEKHLELRKRELKNMGDIAIGLLHGYYRKYEEGVLTEEEARRHVIDELRELRYSNGVGYFWITDMGEPLPRMIMNPLHSELEGKILDDERFNSAGDEKKNFLQQAVEICKESGSGYISYYWPKPTHEGPTHDVPKISYVEKFEPWGWIVGTGLYADDIEEAARERMKQALSRLRNTFSHAKIADTGYMYLFDGDLNLLIHPTLEDADGNFLKNPTTGNRILKDLMGASANPEKPLRYQWEKPPNYVGQYRFWKLSYVRYFAELDWYIGSSVYYDELHQPARKLTQRLVSIVAVFYALSILVALLLSRTITRPLRQLMTAGQEIQKKGIDAAVIPIEGSAETKALGEILDEMIQSIKRAMYDEEQLLKALSTRNKELHLINREAMEAKESAEDANRMKSQFLSSMSHEIRTPLNCIIGFAEAIMGTQELVSAHNKAETILRESDVLLQLINDLLDHAKLEAGKMELESIPVDVYDLMRTVEESVGGYIKEKGLSFRMSIRHGVSRYVMIDPLRLRQILMNLISNAVKFTEKGSVIVYLELVREEDNVQTVRFSVIDTGIGIPQEKQKLVFESFQQVDSSTSRKYGGTGLGTSIVKQLVEKMGGSIGLESEYGNGSTFWFTVALPICTEDQIKALQPGKSVIPKLHIYVGTILVADDYPANQEVIKMHLQSIGLSVDVAANGQEVVDACAEKEYDLILMDIQMPILCGVETTKLLRTQEGWVRQVPILGLTANADIAVKTQCLSAGMNDVLTKPIRKEAFRSCIVQWLYAQHHAEKMRAHEFDAPEPMITPRDKVLDYENAIEEFENDRELYHSLVMRFLDECSEQVKVMYAAYVKNNMESIRQEAHKIKGGALNVFARSLGACAKKIECAITENREAEVGSLLTILKDEIGAIRNFLKKKMEE